MPSVIKERNAKVMQKPFNPSVAERRLKIVIVAALFAGLALSPNLWFSRREFPTIPVSPLLGVIPTPLDHILYAVLLATLVAIAAIARPARFIGLMSLLAITLALFDQSRWQPWFYQYLVMLIAVGLYDHGRGDHDDVAHPALNACRLVVVSIYIWSGLQKANTDFVTNVFPFLTHPLTQLLPSSIGAIINRLGVVAPLFEVGIGIGLLTRRFRTVAIVSGLAMHVLILLAIGPLGQNFNNIVWPWNVAMICFLPILFRQPDLSARKIVWPQSGRYQRVVLVLFGITPLFSFFNAWDGYFSAALYTDPRNAARLYVTNPLADRLPKRIQEHVYLTDKSGINIIKLNEWALSDLNVGINPEPRIYKGIARHICTYARQPSEVRLVIKQTRVLFSKDKEVSYDCSSLGKTL
jgi:hypothetical protein